MSMYLVLGVFLGIIGGTGAGMFIAKGVAARKVAEARSQAEDIVKEARSSAERDSKLLVSEARDEASKVRLEAERDAWNCSAPNAFWNRKKRNSTASWKNSSTARTR